MVPTEHNNGINHYFSKAETHISKHTRILTNKSINKNKSRSQRFTTSLYRTINNNIITTVPEKVQIVPERYDLYLLSKINQEER